MKNIVYQDNIITHVLIIINVFDFTFLPKMSKFCLCLFKIWSNCKWGFKSVRCYINSINP